MLNQQKELSKAKRFLPVTSTNICHNLCRRQLEESWILAFRYYRRLYTSWSKLAPYETIKQLTVVGIHKSPLLSLFVGDPGLYFNQAINLNITKFNQTNFSLEDSLFLDKIPTLLENVFLFGIHAEQKGISLLNNTLKIINKNCIVLHNCLVEEKKLNLDLPTSFNETFALCNTNKIYNLEETEKAFDELFCTSYKFKLTEAKNLLK